MNEFLYMVEPIPKGYTENRVTEMTRINETHFLVMETASNTETGSFFTRLFASKVEGATDVFGEDILFVLCQL